MKPKNNVIANETKAILLMAALYLLLSVNILSAESLAPEHIEGARTINTATAKSLFDNKYPFIDVRGFDDYKTAHIPKAHHLSVKHNFTEQNLRKIVEKDQPVVIYCNGISCMGSSIATQQAVAWGWSNVFYYREGIKDWRQEGYSVQSID